MSKKERTTYPTGPLSYTRMLQALKEALSQEMRSYGLDPSEREVQRLLWRDDMENYTINKWSTRVAGASVPTYVNNEIPAFEGDYVLKFLDPGNRWAAVGVQLGLIPNVKNSIELRWYKESNLDHIHIYFHLLDGVNERACDILWDSINERWNYLTTGYTPVTPVPGGEEKIRDDTWNYLRLIGDFENNTYYRLITTGLEIDMSSIPLYTFPNTSKPFTNLSLIKITQLATQPTYFDDVRIYLNEV